MDCKFSSDDVGKFIADGWLSFQLGNYMLCVELDISGDINYCELINRGSDGKIKQEYVLDRTCLEKTLPKRTEDPSWYHNDPLCPNCRTYMIYKFEHCPKCGQKLDWSER